MHQPTDIFLWANNTEAIKSDLVIDLYVFSKNYTVYSMGHEGSLASQIRELFLFNMLSEVHKGAATGVMVRGFEEAEEESGVIQRTELQYVQRASEVVYAIESTEEAPAVFSQADHEFKRVKGLVARFSGAGARPFYIVKLIPQSQVLKGAQAWLLDEDKLRKFEGDAALRITPDNQVLITNDDIFSFSQAKFEKLFNYDVKKQAIADRKMKEIEANFSLSFGEGLDLQSLIKGKKRLINKLQNITPASIKQDQLLEHADDMELELMTDDAGAIIILDDKDLDKFITLLNDDYISSDLTGIKYKIGSKKPLNPVAVGQPLAMDQSLLA